MNCHRRAARRAAALALAARGLRCLWGARSRAGPRGCTSVTMPALEPCAKRQARQHFVHFPRRVCECSGPRRWHASACQPWRPRLTALAAGSAVQAEQGSWPSCNRSTAHRQNRIKHQRRGQRGNCQELARVAARSLAKSVIRGQGVRALVAVARRMAFD